MNERGMGYRAIQLATAVVFGFVIGCALAMICYGVSGDIRSSLLSGFVFWAATWLFSGIYLTFGRSKWIVTINSLWLLAYLLNITLNLYLAYRYGIDIRSPIVAESVLNASQAETWEYLTEAAPLIGIVIAIIAVIAFALLKFIQVISRYYERYASGLRSRKYLAATLILLSMVPLLNPTVRRATPPLNWIAATKQFHAGAEAQARLAAERVVANQNMASWKPAFMGEPPRTVALVIGESSNRTNWSLYGYARETTPELNALKKDLVVFKDVVSSFGNTITEMTRMLTIATRDGDNAWQQEPTVTALAKYAGYKVFWITNQVDPTINAVFPAGADYFKSVNSGRGGRSDVSLDEKLLPELDKALKDPAPLKFIVLHMIGQHQNYDLRYPESFRKFGNEEDEIAREMADRWSWVRWARAEYDNSILYSDWVLSQFIARLKQQKEDSHLLFVADHAQEVGHSTNRWGHEFQMDSGFTVPMFLWASRPSWSEDKKRELENRPFQTDVLDWTILGLLQIRTDRDNASLVLTGEAYTPRERYLKGRFYPPLAAGGGSVEKLSPQRAE